MAIGGSALPWADRALFAELMLCWELRSYRMAAGRAAPVFFDRGVPDIVGYLRWDGLPVPDHVHAAAKAFRYHRRVLVAPPGQLPAARHATGHAGGTCVVWPPLWAIVISASGGGELRYERYSPGVGSVSLSLALWRRGDMGPALGFCAFLIVLFTLGFLVFTGRIKPDSWEKQSPLFQRVFPKLWGGLAMAMCGYGVLLMLLDALNGRGGWSHH
jgi:hypothetical protein